MNENPIIHIGHMLYAFVMKWTDRLAVEDREEFHSDLKAVVSGIITAAVQVGRRYGR